MRRAGGDRVAEAAADLVGGEGAFLEVLVHELFRALGGGLGEGRVGLLKLGGDLAHVEDVGDAVCGGNGQRAAARAEMLADGGDGRKEVGVFLVETGDDEGDGADAVGLAGMPGADGARLDAGGRVDGDDDGVGGADGAADGAVEVGGAGGVDEGEAVLGVAGLVVAHEGVREDGDLARLLLVVCVGNAGACIDGAEPVVQAELERDGVGKRRLSAAAMSQYREVP